MGAGHITAGGVPVKDHCVGIFAKANSASFHYFNTQTMAQLCTVDGKAGTLTNSEPSCFCGFDEGVEI